MLTFVVLAAGMVAVDAAAQTRSGADDGLLRELRVGVLAHDVGGLWSGFRREDGADFNLEATFKRPSWSFWSGDVVPNIGISINDGGDTSKIYAGVLWEVGGRRGVIFNVGVGGAVHNGELETRDPNKKELGSHVLFRIPIEIGYAFAHHHRISVLFDHISNAFLADPNEGMDTLGIRYGYRF